MFGHNDQQPQDDTQPAASGALDNQGAPAPQINDTAGDYIDDAGPAGGPTVTQPTSGPATDDDSGLGGTSDAPTLPSPTPPAPTEPADNTSVPAASTIDDNGAGTAGAPDADQLLSIKQQALQQLTPLVGHLEQNPEERFRTTMMMIQASDNHSLIQDAYEAAQQIQDEKVRAQALLDIVNEINYFTQNNTEQPAAA